ncbi:hypothetical protein BCR44DRAFT_1423711 [Catenaria anguillulae PL171]|uniref:Uncharacterized protein n=1 Tax=Catenaria anguillulae PL171 TaxID=765915 RepID=A0A1Y2I3E1_9FUNG|nr:hypothetical protein BCR44DRAFT_1423711 [Catenaria anguillulae PL171]
MSCMSTFSRSISCAAQTSLPFHRRCPIRAPPLCMCSAPRRPSPAPLFPERAMTWFNGVLARHDWILRP